MIEIVFSDSACGSLKIAQNYGKGQYIGGACGVIISKADGSEATEDEIQAIQKRYEEQESLAWQKAVPLGGNSADVFGFNLMLSVGDISESGFLVNRHEVLNHIYSIYPYGESFDFTSELNSTLQTIYERISFGEAIRIWYSDNPDETCGLYWFMAQLCHLNNLSEVYTVKLPSWDLKNLNEVSTKTSWGEVHPSEWYGYLKYQETVPQVFVKHSLSIWKTLQQENAPLRAVINGQLLSVSETLYDGFIIREIENAKNEFLEAEIIGRVLGKYKLGIGDYWVANRIACMIEQGKLYPISEPPKDTPIYHRMLKKTINT